MFGTRPSTLPRSAKDWLASRFWNRHQTDVFLTVGVFVTYGLFNGFEDIFRRHPPMPI